jgi:hypothetical protein
MGLHRIRHTNSQRMPWLLEETGEPRELTVLGGRKMRRADSSVPAPAQ